MQVVLQIVTKADDIKVCHVFKLCFLCAHNMVAREYLIKSANDFIDQNYHKLALTVSTISNVFLLFLPVFLLSDISYLKCLTCIYKTIKTVPPPNLKKQTVGFTYHTVPVLCILSFLPEVATFDIKKT